MRSFWIQSRPQSKAAWVCWQTHGLHPVVEPGTGHINSWHGPYPSIARANKALFTLYPNGWTLTPLPTEEEESEAEIARMDAKAENPPADGEYYAGYTHLRRK